MFSSLSNGTQQCHPHKDSLTGFLALAYFDTTELLNIL